MVLQSVHTNTLYPSTLNLDQEKLSQKNSLTGENGSNITVRALKSMHVTEYLHHNFIKMQNFQMINLVLHNVSGKLYKRLLIPQ